MCAQVTFSSVRIPANMHTIIYNAYVLLHEICLGNYNLPGTSILTRSDGKIYEEFFHIKSMF